MTLTAYGIREWGIALVVSLIILVGCAFLIDRAWYWTGGIIAAVTLILLFAFVAFFRNPHREIPSNPKFIVSPADGTIRDIEVIEDFDMPPFNGKAVRVGIFLSVFNVHVNRAPAALKVENVNYREGEFLDARNPQASQRNEAMTISGMAEANGEQFPMAVRQISGAIARRIVCPVTPGRQLLKGEVYGMIKFGSRTELYLPVDKFDISVKIGDKVKGGETVMAVLK